MKNFLSPTFTAEFGWVCPFFWLGVGKCDLLGAGWGWMWMSMGGCGLVWPFLGWVWIGIGACDLFLAGCGWVWVSVTFFGWVWVSVTFLSGCGWVWVSVNFFWLGVVGCGCRWVWMSAGLITAQTISWNFRFWILRILESIALKVCIFLKK